MRLGESSEASSGALRGAQRVPLDCLRALSCLPFWSVHCAVALSLRCRLFIVNAYLSFHCGLGECEIVGGSGLFPSFELETTHHNALGALPIFRGGSNMQRVRFTPAA